MPRLMSVALTAEQVRRREKTVTRRLGWRFLKPGERLTLVLKSQGRKPGEPLVRLAEVEVVDVRREPLDAITHEDVALEGFRWRSEFIEMFCRAMGCTPDTEVTRVAWRYLDEDGGAQ